MPHCAFFPADMLRAGIAGEFRRNFLGNSNARLPDFRSPPDLRAANAEIVYKLELIQGIGKLSRRDRLIGLVPWTGAETVLDVGCGRGLMMVGVAKQLHTGKAVGIDLWQAKDQSNNHPDATLKNAWLEGVADRVEVQTSDMRLLGVGDKTFDVIVSHWAVHNLSDPTERKTALMEMVRVFKPDGYILLADIIHHEEYAATFTEFGLRDVKVIENGLSTQIAAAVSFGSYRPATVFARKYEAPAATFKTNGAVKGLNDWLRQGAGTIASRPKRPLQNGGYCKVSRTARTIAAADSRPNRFCNRRTSGYPSLVSKCLGREKAKMSYQTESSSVRSTRNRSSPISAWPGNVP
jgi:ubiquinone/menaquinone biosynthesis C-methylase UbiE